LDGNYKLMNALIDQNIAVTIDIRNFKLPSMAYPEGPDASEWVNYNIMPFIGKIQIEYIVVGNEAIPGTFGEYVAPAIQDIKNKLLKHNVKVRENFTYPINFCGFCKHS
jgi:hypothetical protein